MATAEWVTPGMKLGHANDLISGPGTFVRGNFVYSSLVGQKRTADEGEQQPPQTTAAESQQPQPQPPAKTKKRVSVIGRRGVAVAPTIGSTATVKITKINTRFATASIVSVGDAALREPFVGIIRSQDVRPTEIDTVEISKCFRPGDVVLTEIISLGDAKSYYLSTAKTELGVIHATSAAGATMVPVSWNQMECPKTKTIEFRKVAKLK